MGAASRQQQSVGYGEKLAVRIITVDKAKSRVECATRDGAMIWAAVWETGTIFRWPEVGETWTVRKDTGIWRLDQIVQNELTEEQSEAVPKTLSDLPEGNTRILGGSVHLNTLFSGDIKATGEVTAPDQSLTTHVRLAPPAALNFQATNGSEMWGRSPTTYLVNVDGVVPKIGNRILLAKQGSEANNGLWELTEWMPKGYTFPVQPIEITNKFLELPYLPSSIVTALSTWPEIFNEGTWSTSEGHTSWKPISYSLVSEWYSTATYSVGSLGMGVMAKVLNNSFSGAGRYFSLWAGIPDPYPSTSEGIRATAVLTATNTYSIFLQEFTAGVVTYESSATGVIAAAPLYFELAVTPTGSRIYVNGGLILSNSNTKFSSGHFGMEGSGSNPEFIPQYGNFTNVNMSPSEYAWTIKRTTDQLRAAQKISVSEGTVNHDTGWVVVTNDPILPQDPVAFNQTDFNTSDTGWLTPVFQNSYENYEAAGTFETAAYRKSIEGRVTLRGLIKHPAAVGVVTVFTLPSGFRPSKQKIFVGWGELAGVGAMAFRIDVAANGAVSISGNGTQGIPYISLAGVTFYADGN